MRVPWLKNDPFRLRIESSIAQFITELVTEGVSNFYAKMQELSTTWFTMFDPLSIKSLPMHTSESHGWVFVDDDKAPTGPDKPNVTELATACRVMRELVQGDSTGRKGFEAMAGWVKKIVEKGVVAYKRQNGEVVDGSDGEDQINSSEEENTQTDKTRKKRKGKPISNVDPRRSKRNRKKQADAQLQSNTPSQQSPTRSKPRAPSKKRKRRDNASPSNDENDESNDASVHEHNINNVDASTRKSQTSGEYIKKKLPVLKKYSAKDPRNDVGNVSLLLSFIKTNY